MVKRIIVGDLHGRSQVFKDIYEKEDPNSVILLGDYWDNRSNMSTEEQEENYLIIRDIQKKHGKKHLLPFIKIIGNHDFHYLVDNQRYSGWNISNKLVAQPLLKEDIEKGLLKFVYVDGVNKTIYSHAGITNQWLYSECGNCSLQDINKLSYHCFEFIGWNPYGDDPGNSPIWVRPRSLSNDMYKDMFGHTWTQVVGHTNVKKPLVLTKGKIEWNPDIDTWENGLLWIIDCMPKYYIRETLNDELVITNREIVEV